MANRAGGSEHQVDGAVLRLGNQRTFATENAGRRNDDFVTAAGASLKIGGKSLRSRLEGSAFGLWVPELEFCLRMRRQGRAGKAQYAEQ